MDRAVLLAVLISVTVALVGLQMVSGLPAPEPENEDDGGENNGDEPETGAGQWGYEGAHLQCLVPLF